MVGTLFFRENREKTAFFRVNRGFRGKKRVFRGFPRKKFGKNRLLPQKNRVRPRKYYFCSSVVALCMGTLRGRSFRVTLFAWDALRDAL